MLGSMRARMTLAFACCMASLLLVTCLLLISSMQQAAERNAEEALENATTKIHHELPDNILNKAELHEVETDLDEEHIALVLLDLQGRVVDESRGAASFRKALPHLKVGNPDDASWRSRTVPLGQYTIFIGLPWLQTRRALHDQALLSTALSLVTVAAATLGAWLLVGWTLSPISRVSQQAQAATVDGGYVQLKAPSKDAEVLELIATLNALLARQHEATMARGRFYAAASHELRTPLQALSGHLELALQRPRAQEEYRAVVQEANAQTQRLTALTRALLQLYRLEGDPHPHQAANDLALVCAHALQTFAPSMEAKKLQVQSEIPPRLFVKSVPTHADILVRNLLENAVRYAPPGGVVRICLTAVSEAKPSEAKSSEAKLSEAKLSEAKLSETKTAGLARLEIRNSSEIAADCQLEKWLEPFYRPDTSRNAHTGGNGLGLALCKAIARANGWQLSLRHEGTFIVAEVDFEVE